MKERIAEKISELEQGFAGLSYAQSRLAEIKEEGGSLFLVGGAVRDLLLGEKPEDLDFLLVGVNSNKLSDIFPKNKKMKEDLNLYMVLEPAGGFFEVQLAPDVESGLSGRDFGLNSIACEVVSDFQGEKFEIVDKYGGVSDIRNSEIAVISDAIEKDPIRIYRAFRFAIRHGLFLSEGTVSKIKESKELLRGVKPERVFEELKKVFLLENPSEFFRQLRDYNLLGIHFSELKSLVGVPQTERYHPEGDVFVHSMLVLDELVGRIDNNLSKERRSMLAFSVLMHDIGKGITPEDNYPHHYSHSKLGLDVFDELIERKPYVLPDSWIKATKFFIKNHMRANYLFEMNPGKVVSLLERIKRSPFSCEEYMQALSADKYGRGDNSVFDRKCFACKLKLLKYLFSGMYKETSGNDIDQERYSGEEIGEQLFLLRCRYIQGKKKEFFEDKSELRERCM